MNSRFEKRPMRTGGMRIVIRYGRHACVDVWQMPHERPTLFPGTNKGFFTKGMKVSNTAARTYVTLRKLFGLSSAYTLLVPLTEPTIQNASFERPQSESPLIGSAR